jgi:hypothetical protein
MSRGFSGSSRPSALPSTVVAWTGGTDEGDARLGSEVLGSEVLGSEVLGGLA